MGGKKRAEKLSKERRSEIAKAGANARWSKKHDLTPLPVKEPVKVRRCQASFCLNIGDELEIEGLKAWLCKEHQLDKTSWKRN